MMIGFGIKLINSLLPDYKSKGFSNEYLAMIFYPGISTLHNLSWEHQRIEHISEKALCPSLLTQI